METYEKPEIIELDQMINIGAGCKTCKNDGDSCYSEIPVDPK
jgi:hypothetical protein